MPESSENSNTSAEVSESQEEKSQKPDPTPDAGLAEKSLLGKLNLEKLTEKLSEICLNPVVVFDDEKWTKICKITRNILVANVKQFGEEVDESRLSNFNPVVLSDNLKVSSHFTPTEGQKSTKLWDLSNLELISLASAARTSDFSLSFKLVDSTHSRPKYMEPAHAKYKVMHKIPPITIHGKQFKYDSTQLISLIQKSQRPPVPERPQSEVKGRVLEKFEVKTEVKIPPHWDKRVGYEDPKWDMPSYGAGSIFSLGALKNDKGPNEADLTSATSALKNLSCLVQDFQVSKKPNSEGMSDDLSQLNINDINNFAFVDDDVDDSLKCSRFSKFFKVLKDQQDNQP